MITLPRIQQIIQEERSSRLKEISRRWALSLTRTYCSFFICPAIIWINQWGAVWKPVILCTRVEIFKGSVHSKNKSMFSRCWKQHWEKTNKQCRFNQKWFYCIYEQRGNGEDNEEVCLSVQKYTRNASKTPQFSSFCADLWHETL